jgi:general secretion pathway protein K
MTGDTRGHIHRISDLGDSAKIEAALDGALAVGVYGLVQASTHPDAIRSRYIRVGSYIVTFTVRPEGSKLDLNAAPESSLAALFHAAGASDAQATALAAETADWRDEDDLVRPNGAEFRDYAQHGSSSRPSNTRFQTVAELANLLSMNQTIFDCVRPYVTVYAQRAQIDAYYAAPFLTRALDLSMPTTEEGQAIVTPLSPALGDVFEVTARVTLARPSMRRSKRWIVRFVGNQKDPYWILDIDSPGPIEAASNAACPRSVSNQG